MSLFKAREWWSTVSGFEEFHTNRLLVTTSLTSDTLQYDECVLVGSFSGILRGYRPHPGEYSPNNLLLEQQLDAPIIQLAVEHTVENDNMTIDLFVLHPQSVALYSLVLDEHQTNQLTMNLKYKHTLKHVSHSMVTGPLGRVTGHDLVCVQSMDGRVTVVDNNETLFKCDLSDFFLPGPMAYNPRTDSLVTVGSGRQLEVYRYQSLVNAGTHSAKHVKWEWCIELGEEAVDLKLSVQEDGVSLILVLGERSLYCFQDNSQLLFSKKLEHYFTVIHPYKMADNEVYYLLAGHSFQLQVMKNETMLWAAQLSHVPVAMTTANFRELEGVIVTLDELGHLQCSYLGTNPLSNAIKMGGANYTSLSLKEMEQETRELQEKIIENEESVKESTSEGPPIEVVIKGFSKPRPLEIEDVLEGDPNDQEPLERQAVDGVIRIINSSSIKAISDVQVNIDVTTPITIKPSTTTYSSIAVGSGYEELTVSIECSSEIPVGSLQAILTVSHVDDRKMVHTIEQTLTLPLELVSKPCAPQDGNHKVTLDSSMPCVALSKLYPDNQEGKSANAVAFQLLWGPSVTVIVSKTSDKYRVQSDDFSCLGLVIEDIVRRITEHHRDNNQEVRLKISSPSPLSEYFEIIDEHYKIRVGLEQCKELLSRHAHQFRAIQKRLLSRFKDKTPIGLTHFDTLLDGTYMQLLMLADKCDTLNKQEQILIRKLSSSSLLVATFLSLNANLSSEETSILFSTLAPYEVFNSDQGWEEVVDTSITQLLRSCLAKSVKDQSTSLPPMGLPGDCAKLKRHIALLSDRIHKGGKLTVTRSLIETTPTTLGQLPALTEDEEAEQ